MSVDYRKNISWIPDNFSSQITNEDLNLMFHSPDGATQLRAAFVLSLKQNKVICELKVLFNFFFFFL